MKVIIVSTVVAMALAAAVEARAESRLPEKVQHSLEKPYSLKENGIFSEQTWTMTRELVKVGVPMEQVGSAVKAVAQGFGVNVKGCISARSVGRITLEGGLAAQLQMWQGSRTQI